MAVRIDGSEDARFGKVLEISKLVYPPVGDGYALPVPGDCSLCSRRFLNYQQPLSPDINYRSHFLFIDRSPSRHDLEHGRHYASGNKVSHMFEEFLVVLGLERQEISLSSAVYCNSLNHQPPVPGQVNICGQAWKSKELSNIECLKFIVLMGAFPVCQMLGWDYSLTRNYGISYYVMKPHPIIILSLFAPGHLVIDSDNKDLAFRHMTYIRDHYVVPYRKAVADGIFNKDWLPF